MPEQRFLALRKRLKPEEFNSIDFLTNEAKALEESDPELSKRILVRVKRLIGQSKRQAKNTVTNEESNVNASILTNEKNTLNIQASSAKKTSHSLDHNVKESIKNIEFKKILNLSPFILLVIFPTLLFALYQTLWATERFDSQAKVTVQQPDNSSTLDPSMALLSGISGTSGGTDTELVKAYIYSNDMIDYLNGKIGLREHYSQSFIDYFSRIHDSDSRETLYQFYQKHIEVIIDDKSGIITINSQAFDSHYAQKISNIVVERAEWFINSIGHQLANAQLGFMQGEHKLIEERFTEAKKQLLTFQQKYNLLDPTAEGTAKQNITNTIEGQIATKQTEIKTLKAIMSDRSPQVQGLKNELAALNQQLEEERNKLSQTGLDEIPVSEIMSKFTDYQIKMDLALQAYTSSQISLEKSRVEAYRQIKYLIVVEKSTLSEDSKYPNVFYNISLFLLLLSLVFGVGKIIISTVNELK